MWTNKERRRQINATRNEREDIIPTPQKGS
jgi:hypothetical protein